MLDAFPIYGIKMELRANQHMETQYYQHFSLQVLLMQFVILLLIADFEPFGTFFQIFDHAFLRFVSNCNMVEWS